MWKKKENKGRNILSITFRYLILIGRSSTLYLVTNYNVQ